MSVRKSFDFYLENLFQEPPLTDEEFAAIQGLFEGSDEVVTFEAGTKLLCLGSVLPGVALVLYGDEERASFSLSMLHEKGIGSADLLPAGSDPDAIGVFCDRIRLGRIDLAYVPMAAAVLENMKARFKAIDFAQGFNFVFVDSSLFDEADLAAMPRNYTRLKEVMAEAPTALTFLLSRGPVPEAGSATVIREPGSAASQPLPGVTEEEKAELLKPLTPDEPSLGEPVPIGEEEEEGLKTTIREPLPPDHLEALMEQVEASSVREEQAALEEAGAAGDGVDGDLLSAVGVALEASEKPSLHEETSLGVEAAGDSEDSVELETEGVEALESRPLREALPGDEFDVLLAGAEAESMAAAAKDLEKEDAGLTPSLGNALSDLEADAAIEALSEADGEASLVVGGDTEEEAHQVSLDRGGGAGESDEEFSLGMDGETPDEQELSLDFGGDAGDAGGDFSLDLPGGNDEGDLSLELGLDDEGGGFSLDGETGGGEEAMDLLSMESDSHGGDEGDEISLSLDEGGDDFTLDLGLDDAAGSEDTALPEADAGGGGALDGLQLDFGMEDAVELAAPTLPPVSEAGSSGDEAAPPNEAAASEGEDSAVTPAEEPPQPSPPPRPSPPPHPPSPPPPSPPEPPRPRVAAGGRSGVGAVPRGPGPKAPPDEEVPLFLEEETPSAGEEGSPFLEEEMELLIEEDSTIIEADEEFSEELVSLPDPGAGVVADALEEVAPSETPVGAPPAEDIDGLADLGDVGELASGDVDLTGEVEMEGVNDLLAEVEDDAALDLETSALDELLESVGTEDAGPDAREDPGASEATAPEEDVFSDGISQDLVDSLLELEEQEEAGLVDGDEHVGADHAQEKAFVNEVKEESFELAKKEHAPSKISPPEGEESYLEALDHLLEGAPGDGEEEHPPTPEEEAEIAGLANLLSEDEPLEVAPVVEAEAPSAAPVETAGVIAVEQDLSDMLHGLDELMEDAEAGEEFLDTSVDEGLGAGDDDVGATLQGFEHIGDVITSIISGGETEEPRNAEVDGPRAETEDILSELAPPPADEAEIEESFRELLVDELLEEEPLAEPVESPPAEAAPSMDEVFGDMGLDLEVEDGSTRDEPSEDTPDLPSILSSDSVEAVQEVEDSSIEEAGEEALSLELFPDIEEEPQAELQVEPSAPSAPPRPEFREDVAPPAISVPRAEAPASDELSFEPGDASDVWPEDLPIPDEPPASPPAEAASEPAAEIPTDPSEWPMDMPIPDEPAPESLTAPAEDELALEAELFPEGGDELPSDAAAAEAEELLGDLAGDEAAGLGEDDALERDLEAELFGPPLAGEPATAATGGGNDDLFRLDVPSEGGPAEATPATEGDLILEDAVTEEDVFGILPGQDGEPSGDVLDLAVSDAVPGLVIDEGDEDFEDPLAGFGSPVEPSPEEELPSTEDLFPDLDAAAGEPPAGEAVSGVPAVGFGTGEDALGADLGTDDLGLDEAIAAAGAAVDQFAEPDVDEILQDLESQMDAFSQDLDAEGGPPRTSDESASSEEELPGLDEILPPELSSGDSPDETLVEDEVRPEEVLPEEMSLQEVSSPEEAAPSSDITDGLGLDDLLPDLDEVLPVQEEAPVVEEPPVVEEREDVSARDDTGGAEEQGELLPEEGLSHAGGSVPAPPDSGEQGELLAEEELSPLDEIFGGLDDEGPELGSDLEGQVLSAAGDSSGGGPFDEDVEDILADLEREVDGAELGEVAPDELPEDSLLGEEHSAAAGDEGPSSALDDVLADLSDDLLLGAPGGEEEEAEEETAEEAAGPAGPSTGLGKLEALLDLEDDFTAGSRARDVHDADRETPGGEEALGKETLGEEEPVEPPEEEAPVEDVRTSGSPLDGLTFDAFETSAEEPFDPFSDEDLSSSELAGPEALQTSGEQDARAEEGDMTPGGEELEVDLFEELLDRTSSDGPVARAGSGAEPEGEEPVTEGGEATPDRSVQPEQEAALEGPEPPAAEGPLEAVQEVPKEAAPEESLEVAGAAEPAETDEGLTLAEPPVEEEPPAEVPSPDEGPWKEPFAEISEELPEEVPELSEEILHAVEPSPSLSAFESLEPLPREPAMAPWGERTWPPPEEVEALGVPEEIERLKKMEADFASIHREIVEMWEDPESGIGPLLDLAHVIAQKAPRDRAAQFIAGTLEHLQNHLSRAIMHFEWTLELCQAVGDTENESFLLGRLHEILPSDPGIAERLAEVYQKLDRSDDASALMREMGEQLLEAEAVSQAIAWFDRAHKIAQDDLHSVLGLAQAYRTEGDDGRALSILDEALRQHPEQPLLLTEKGISLARISRTKAAEVCLQKALENAWDSPDVLDQIAGVLGDTEFVTFQDRCRSRRNELDPASDLGGERPPTPPGAAVPGGPGGAGAAPPPEGPEASPAGLPPGQGIPWAEDPESVHDPHFLEALRTQVPRFARRIQRIEGLEREVLRGRLPDAQIADLLKNLEWVADRLRPDRPEDALRLYRRGESFISRFEDAALRVYWREEFLPRLTAADD